MAAARPTGPPAIAAIAAPVPAPRAPVLTARHPGVTPQPDSASDAIVKIARPVFDAMSIVLPKFRRRLPSLKTEDAVLLPLRIPEPFINLVALFKQLIYLVLKLVVSI